MLRARTAGSPTPGPGPLPPSRQPASATGPDKQREVPAPRQTNHLHVILTSSPVRARPHLPAWCLPPGRVRCAAAAQAVVAELLRPSFASCHGWSSGARECPPAPVRVRSLARGRLYRARRFDSFEKRGEPWGRHPARLGPAVGLFAAVAGGAASGCCFLPTPSPCSPALAALEVWIAPASGDRH